MDEQQHQQLIDLLDELKTDPLRRAEFLKEPLKTLAPLIGASTMSSTDLSLSNQVLLATLQNPQLMDELHGLSVQHQSGQIDDAKLTELSAGSLGQNLPVELKQKINQPGLTGTPGLGPVAMANVIAHVDVAVVVTEIAVVHGTYVFNGMTDRSILKLKDVANMLAEGQ